VTASKQTSQLNLFFETAESPKWDVVGADADRSAPATQAVPKSKLTARSGPSAMKMELCHDVVNVDLPVNMGGWQTFQADYLYITTEEQPQRDSSHSGIVFCVRHAGGMSTAASNGSIRASACRFISRSMATYLLGVAQKLLSTPTPGITIEG
jgi:hypothetical protein